MSSEGYGQLAEQVRDLAARKELGASFGRTGQDGGTQAERCARAV